MSCGLSAEGVVALILSQVCRAVSSIPVRSALAGPWGLNFSSTRRHTVTFAGSLFSVGSCSSHGPLNNFDSSTVRIVSFVEVTSISSLSGHSACASIRFCILFLSSRWFPVATSALYLLIAFRADFMFMDISPFGVFLALVHRWQNQSWGGKLKFLS